MVKNLLKSIPMMRVLVNKLRRFIKFININFYIAVAGFFHFFELKRVRKKLFNGKKIDVIFLVMEKSVWKTDLIFQGMEKDSRYNPCIVVIPRINATNILENAENTYKYFKEKGYKTRISYSNGNWQKLESISNIDIVFFSNPHQISLPQYLISSLYKKLSCYVPYFEQIDTNYEGHFNGVTENLCWKVFQINDIHKNIALKYAFNRGRNIDVVGYPATEPLYNSTKIKFTPWKENSLKKIIIAPHHSIANSSPLANATFLETAETLQTLPALFKHSVCFAFKPHPMLKEKLYKHPDWGVNKTDLYWHFWSTQENTQFEDADYIDLFKTSDAMIHDCSSFIIEYLYVKKPCLYLNSNIRNGLNEYGKIGYDAITKAKNNEDIIEFVKSVVDETATPPQYSSEVNLIPRESPTKKIMTILNAEIECGK
ncbi:CDP-glycerol glycerophosphotransferase family protein [Psychromonas sp. Urea-02u-13]|uniref:CDP-glycerol glycerophosphotransferase family protein n=1 Tax=Psychromonas sp. Urea-02u-13 TaxID=2058326 RepID=UPI0012FF4391|nr:CDP-glycerol glycerophosphotransferase family protein [Psychromonas sp. Urea-02u-13]